MKLFFFFLGCALCTAQVAIDSAYSITYLSSFKINDSNDRLFQEYMRLMVDGDKTLYQSYNSMVLDTANTTGETTSAFRNKYFSRNTYAIETIGNDLTYYEHIGNDGYSYKEQLDFKWQLTNESKEIKGYTCKKATTIYGGREWIAWYAPDVAINAGPYKFKGLPGLIIKLTDTTNDYDFEIYAIIKKKAGKLKKYYHRKPIDEKIEMTRIEFNEFKEMFKNLTLNEALNYMNNTSPGTLSFKVTTLSGEEKDVGANRPPKGKKVFIEIDHRD